MGGLCSEKLEAQDIDRWTASYTKKQVAVLRYHLVQRFDGPQAGAEFLHANRELSDVREMAIREAIEQRRHEEALQYAREGEEQDARQGYPGLVERWKQLRLEVYRQTGNVALERELTEEFASSGEYDYYQRLKKLYKPEEWPDVYARVLDELEKKRNWKAEATYRKLLIEENETERLLSYVNRHPFSVVDNYQHLIKSYPDEVYRLFGQHIESSMQGASNRNGYKKVCQIIRQLVKAGGTKTAREIVDQFRLRYPNRPALLNELDQIRL